MGNVFRKKKDYNLSPKVANLVVANEPTGYAFEIKGVDFDFTPFIRNKEQDIDIAWAFARAFWVRRNECAIDTHKTDFQHTRRFFEYLQKESPRTISIHDINSDLLHDYLYWLKFLAQKKSDDGNKFLTETTRRKAWGTVRTLIQRLQIESILSHEIDLPHNNFANATEESFKPYSNNERKQIIAACKKDILHLRKHGKAFDKEISSNILSHLIPHALLISLRTGINPEVLFELPVTKYCIKSSNLLNSERLILPIKIRSGHSQNISLTTVESTGDSVRIKTRITELLREVEALTDDIRVDLDDSNPLKKKLWLTGKYGDVMIFRDRTYYTSLQIFVKRHEIIGDDKKPLVLNFRRFRPTFAEAILKANGGDVRDLQNRLGHLNIRTTMGYLDPNLDGRKKNFAFSGKAMQVWALGTETNPDIQSIADSLGIDLDSARSLVSGDFNMGATKCKNPLNSPLNKVKEGDICTNFLACFRCGNCVVLKEDANRLFSFYHWILHKKMVLGQQKWTDTYQWIVDIIDQDIAPQLGDDAWIQGKKAEAKAKPFPMWALGNSESFVLNTEGLQ